MPLFGAHMSITGGLEKAVERIISVKGTALQIFSKNQRQWKSTVLTQTQIDTFKAAVQRWGDYPVAIHDSYLINLATPKEDAAVKSVNAFADELKRAEHLAVSYVVTHPGSHVGSGTDAAIKNIASRIDEAVALSETAHVMVLLENTAGQGTSVGASFAELGRIIAASSCPERIGMCLDTAHAFEAGYDWRTSEGFEAAIMEIDSEIGLEKLRFVHLNDSKTEYASRVDRHDHIGKGHIGEEAFSRIVCDERLRHLPMVLETHKEDDLEDDRMNLATLRRLAGKYADQTK